jgi:DNA anti-recombination protein RmuC
LKNPDFLYIATLKNEEEEATEAWEGKIKAINKKLDTGFASMEKDILQNIRKEVRGENEAMQKQVRAEIGSIKREIGGMKEEAEITSKRIEDSL